MRRSVTARGHSVTSLLFVVYLTAGLLATPHASRAPTTARGSPEPRVIDVIAKRYAFEPAEIEVTEGERVRLVVRSADGLHGIEITQFRVSKEIPRGGELVVIEFTASEAGRFPILCSVYCGDGHDEMKGALVVTARASAQQP